jgi:hypothetical protein
MLGNVFTSAGQLLAGHLGMVAQMIGAGFTLVVCVAVWAIGWNRRQRAANKPGMSSLPFIAACFAIALIAVGGGAYGVGLRSAIAIPVPPNAPDPSRRSEINYTKTEAEKLINALGPLSETYDSASETAGTIASNLLYFSREIPQFPEPISNPANKNGPEERRAFVLRILDNRDNKLEQLNALIIALNKAADNKPKEKAELFEPVDSIGSVTGALVMYRTAIQYLRGQTPGDLSYKIVLAPANELLNEHLQVFKRQIDTRRQEIASETTKIRDYLR